MQRISDYIALISRWDMGIYVRSAALTAQRLLWEREKNYSKRQRLWTSAAKHSSLDMTGHCIHEIIVAVSACTRPTQSNHLRLSMGGGGLTVLTSS